MSSRIWTPNRVPASSAEANLERGAALYERFTGMPADQVVRMPAPICPRELVAIGPCDGVLYSTVRDYQEERYIHEFKKKARPLLCVSTDGSEIWLLGGAYHFTARGIVDR
jgi:hypothetical protein